MENTKSGLMVKQRLKQKNKVRARNEPTPSAGEVEGIYARCLNYERISIFRSTRVVRSNNYKIFSIFLFREELNLIHWPYYRQTILVFILVK